VDRLLALVVMSLLASPVAARDPIRSPLGAVKASRLQSPSATDQNGSVEPARATPATELSRTVQPQHRDTDRDAPKVFQSRNAQPGGLDRTLAVTNADNQFTRPQRITAPARQDVHALSLFGSGHVKHSASPLDIENVIAGVPSGVVPNIFSSTKCHGQEAAAITAFNGCSGQYVFVSDDASVTAANPGVLYGINIAIAPLTERGTKSPSDDADALVISNVGTAKGTESVYWGRNKAISQDWGAVMGIDASAEFVLYSSGDYGWGWAMAHGAKSTFSKGVFLVPTPDTGVTPILVLGNDFATLSANKVAMQTDASGNLIFPRATRICKDSWAGKACAGFEDALVIEANDGTGIALTDGGATNAQQIHLDPATGDLAFSRLKGSRYVRFDEGVRLLPGTVSALPACNAAEEGLLTAVTDASAATFNAVLSGGGKHHVLGYCNGTNWTVR